jgi:hypothetical protein
MKPEIKEATKTFIRDNPDAQRAYQAMLARGIRTSDAEAEIARVLLACIWQAARYSLTDASNLTTALRALEGGSSAQQLFATEGEMDEFDLDEPEEAQSDEAQSDKEARYRQFLEGFLATYRDELLAKGMSRDDVDRAIRMVQTEPAIVINTLEDYKRACRLYNEMEGAVPKDDWRSPAAVQLVALGGEMIRFEEEYEREHGELPDTR